MDFLKYVQENAFEIRKNQDDLSSYDHYICDDFAYGFSPKFYLKKDSDGYSVYEPGNEPGLGANYYLRVHYPTEYNLLCYDVYDDDGFTFTGVVVKQRDLSDSKIHFRCIQKKVEKEEEEEETRSSPYNTESDNSIWKWGTWFKGLIYIAAFIFSGGGILLGMASPWLLLIGPAFLALWAILILLHWFFH